MVSHLHSTHFNNPLLPTVAQFLVPHLYLFCFPHLDLGHIYFYGGHLCPMNSKKESFSSFLPDSLLFHCDTAAPNLILQVLLIPQSNTFLAILLPFVCILECPPRLLSHLRSQLSTPRPCSCGPEFPTPPSSIEEVSSCLTIVACAWSSKRAVGIILM